MKSFRNATDTFKELIIIYLSVIVVCAGLFAFFESKPFFDSIWWAFVTAMSVGYGDMYPVTLGGRITAVVLMCTSLLVIIPLIITRLVEKMLDDRDKFTHEEQTKLLKDVVWLKRKLKALTYGQVEPIKDELIKLNENLIDENNSSLRLIKDGSV